MNQRDFLIISIGIFLTIIAWVVMDIYQAQNKHVIEKQVKGIESVQYNIDESIFKVLLDKK